MCAAMSMILKWVILLPEFRQVPPLKICRRIGPVLNVVLAKKIFPWKNKLKRIFILLAVTVCAGLLSGCSWAEARRNLDNARALRIGMTKAQVLEIMGEPVKDEIFTRPDVWFYFIEPVWVDGLTTEDECMPLVFENGKLVGWGNEYYARTRLMPAMPKTNAENVRELDLSGK